MEKAYSILVVDDDEDILTSARLLLKRHYSKVNTSSNPADLNTLLSKLSPDVVLLDMNFSLGRNDGREGLYWLDHIREIAPQTQVILMTAYGEVSTAVTAIKKGAFDFLLKPWTNQKLLETVAQSLKLKKAHQTQPELKAPLQNNVSTDAPELQSRSAEMQRIIKTLDKLAATEANILLLGENGTGKSMLAGYIHQKSKRAKATLVTVDLGAVHNNLFESELFGHVKGAFTDAREDRDGRFVQAQNSTLFLDEIGNLDGALQAKLLTALQNRNITPVGSSSQIPVDVRLITATNSHINELVAKGLFRQDLLYRINTVEIKVPALRERKEDIPMLAQQFLKKYKEQYQRQALELAPAAIEKLMQYNWPGNIRELEHTIERAVILSEQNAIVPGDLQLEIREQMQPQGMNLEEMETHLISKAIEKHQGNISKAANELGLTRAALYRRIEKYGL